METASSTTQTIMETIGLSKEEAKLYEAILINGALTPGELSVHLNFPIDKVESLLEKLEKERIVRRIPGVAARYSIAPPFKKLEETLGKFRKEAENFRKTIDQKFKETLEGLANSINTWKSDVKNVIDVEFAKISDENKAMTKNLEQFSLQTSEALGMKAEKGVKELSESLEKQYELLKTQIQEYETHLHSILDQNIEKGEKGRELRQKELEEKIDNGFKYTVDNVQKLKRDIQKNLSNTSKNLSDCLNQLEAKNTDLLERSLVKFDELANEAKNKTLSVLSNHQNDFATDLEELLTSVDRTLQNQVKFRGENLNLLHNSIEQAILENSVGSAKTLSDFHRVTSKTLNKLYRDHEKDVASISEKLTELVNTGYNRASSIIDGVKLSVDKHLESHMKSLSREYKDFQTEFSKIIDTGNMSFAGTSSNLQKHYIDTINQQISITTETAENLKSKIEESVKSDIQEISSTLVGIQNSVRENLQSEIEVYDSNLAGVKDTIFSSLDDSKSALLTSAQTVSKDMFQNIDQEIKGFESVVKKIREKFSETLNFNLEEIKREAELVKRGFAEFLDKRIFDIEDYAQDIKRQASTTISSRLDQMSVSFELLQNQSTNIIDGLIARFTDLMNETKENFSKVINSNLESFKKDAYDLNLTIESALDQRVSDFENELQSIKESFLMTIDEKIVSIAQSLAKLVEDADNILVEQSKETNQLAYELDARIMEGFKRHVDEFGAKITNVKQVTKNTFSKGAQDFRERITSVQSTIDATLNDKLELIKNTDTKIESELAGRIAFIIEENRKSMDNLKDVIEQSIKSNLESLEGEINRLKDSISSLIGKRLEEKRLESEKLTKELSEKIDGEKQTLENIGTILFNEANNTLKSHVNSTREEINKSRESLLMSVSELIQTIREVKERTVKSTLKSMQRELENYRIKMGALNEEIANLMQKQSEKLARSTENSMMETDETIQKVVQENKTLIDSTKAETHDAIISVSKNIDETLKAARFSLNNTVKTILKSNEEQMGDLKSSLVESLDRYAEELRNSVQNSKEESSQLVKNQLEGYGKVTGEIKEKLIDTITEYSRALKQTMSEIQSRIGENLTKHENDIKETTEKIQEDITSNLEKTEDQIVSSVREASSTAAKLLEETERDSSKTVELLDAAWRQLEKTKPSEIQKTWHLVTKKSIITHIRDMIRRASKTVTVIVPDIQDVPLEEIAKKEEPVMVHLITDFSDEQLKDLAELAKKRVRVWRRTERDLYGCVRDQQEILLAPAKPSEVPVAVISEDEGYIKVSQRVILPNLIAKAKEIRL
ncbi:MAG: helix-turn-helix domain-containing protein [Candidatus Freyarchaeota archaeon]